MCNYSVNPRKSGILKLLEVIPCLLLFTNFLQAQNTSYNANTIPIGGSLSTAFGSGALHISTGSSNVANGYNALFSNTTGSFNSANGYNALYYNTTGLLNIANGVFALYFNTTGNSNTANGYSALQSNTIGAFNTANGREALYSNISGAFNTANGVSALYSNTTGFNNTANGYNALENNTTGFYNTANGYNALQSNTTGDSNTVNGVFALPSNTTGSGNTANGYSALSSNTTGQYNTSIGNSAGFNALGSGNVFIGNNAGYNETGSNKIYLGNDAAETLLYGDFSTGQVLLGNPNPTGYVFKGTRTLNVLGGIITDSMRVALSGLWADHVFYKNFQLQPLSELEQYIRTNKHLPGIPSASEVESNGVNVAEMDAKLLEKIEDLTLYIIDLKKESQKQQQEINKLKRRRK